MTVAKLLPFLLSFPVVAGLRASRDSFLEDSVGTRALPSHSRRSAPRRRIHVNAAHLPRCSLLGGYRVNLPLTLMDTLTIPIGDINEALVNTPEVGLS